MSYDITKLMPKLYSVYVGNLIDAFLFWNTEFCHFDSVWIHEKLKILLFSFKKEKVLSRDWRGCSVAKSG